MKKQVRHSSLSPTQESPSDKYTQEQEFIPVNMFALFILSIFINHNRRDICCQNCKLHSCLGLELEEVLQPKLVKLRGAMLSLGGGCVASY